MAAGGFDPITYSVGQRQFYEAAYNSLLAFKEDGTVGPGLASAYEFNEDGTVLTLTLQNDVTFSDKSTLSSALVAANLERRSDPEMLAYSGFAPGGDAEITSVDTPDDSTVVITFAKPQFSIDQSLANVPGMIVGQTALDDPSLLDKAPVGSGPYVLDTAKTVKGSTYTFGRNKASNETDEYPFDTVVFRPIIDPQARANAVISGRPYATPDDIRGVAEAVLAHRLVLVPELEGDSGARSSVVDDVLAKVGYRRAVRPV
jgi:peptide/nickel transport system substrate-binding protein